MLDQPRRARLVDLEFELGFQDNPRDQPEGRPSPTIIPPMAPIGDYSDGARRKFVAIAGAPVSPEYHP
jgi:hypothetical protein